MLSKIIFYIEKYSVALFLMSVFLIRTPPVYLGFRSPLSTSHTLARLLVMGIFIGLVFGRRLLKSKLSVGQIKLLYVYFGFLFFQSFSIFPAFDLVIFFQRYKDIVFPGLFLITFLWTIKSDKILIKILFYGVVINFLYQLVMFFVPDFFIRFGGDFLYGAHFDLVNINLQRGRLFIETYDEAILPLVFLAYFSAKDKKTDWRKSWWHLGLFFLIAFPSFFSNFRSRILMFVLAFLGSLLFLRKRFFSSLTMLGGFIGVMIVSATLLSSIVGFSFIDRFLLVDRIEDQQTIDSRFKQVSTGIELAQIFPLTGVGLGNYFAYIPQANVSSLSLFEWRNLESRIAGSSPHNIFALIGSETGVLSLAYYMFMLFYFLIVDLKIMFKGKNYRKRAWVLSFWTLFFYSLFNPTVTLTYNSMFWIFRGAILL